MTTLKESQRSSETPFETYWREISEVALLTADEEKMLAERIAKGDPAAREHMIRANLRFVVSIARGYMNRGLPFEDLIEEGNIGLMTAVEKFDPAYKTRFSTYASYWIMQNIKRALINTVGTIRIPVYMQEVIAKWRKIVAEYKVRGKDPEPHAVMKRLQMSRNQYDMMMETIVDLDKQTTGGIRSSDEFPLEEMLVDRTTPDPSDEVADLEEVALLHDNLNKMDEREAQVLKLRYGLNRGIQEKTLEEVGEVIHVTRERARQIQLEAEEKLARLMWRHRA